MILTAVYDLAVSPPTYDFVGFLVSAEKRRREIGATAIDMVIVPGPQDGFRADSLPPFGADARLRMRRNVVESLCRLLPSCRSVAVVDRHDVKIEGPQFPERWRALSPISHYGTARMLACAWAGVFPLIGPGGRKWLPQSVSFTLREASYWPTRNSNRAAWLRAADVLANEGWNISIVPDTESAPLPDGPWTIEARDKAEDRASLYAACEVNLFINNGPAWMTLFLSGVNSAIVRMESEDAPCVSPEFFAGCGLSPGAQIGKPGHYIAWAKEETPEIIVDCVHRLQWALAA